MIAVLNNVLQLLPEMDPALTRRACPSTVRIRTLKDGATYSLLPEMNLFLSYYYYLSYTLVIRGRRGLFYHAGPFAALIKDTKQRHDDPSTIRRGHGALPLTPQIFLRASPAVLEDFIMARTNTFSTNMPLFEAISRSLSDDLWHPLQ